ncbi:L-rhamnose mutarotase [Rhodanobacter sp. A1T4]|jgi:L-rhamnose mutarotase|uniref:L-rhamnose mutarotase n=1 Tax=Rhodanobacter sp. A1T4 TaxID=2723087 RepID=UPI00161E65DC|nr:L-rhamnose mutarotase [Rhodanobacter sp. A1T4]MBB6247663.1 L-rhamnose mutarotase [Rhodanobacter sp. A1T4]
MRLYFALDLRDDEAAIREYEQWHQPDRIWPEIVASIRAAGIDDMEIFRTGNRLVMAMEVGPAFDPVAKAAADAADPRVHAWEQMMEHFQQALPWASAGQKWVPMARIFSLRQCGE